MRQYVKKNFYVRVIFNGGLAEGEAHLNFDLDIRVNDLTIADLKYALLQRGRVLLDQGYVSYYSLWCADSIADIAIAWGGDVHKNSE